MIGETLGNYRIVSKIGKGGMGAVYLAEHAMMARRAAIKVLLPAFSHQPAVVRRFFNEARASARLQHPSLVAIYDCGRHESTGSAYLIMDYLEGESLSRRLRRVGKLPVSLAISYAQQIAAGMAVAHQAGIIHRDLKPGNVFLVPDREAGGDSVRILDFGVAKLSALEGPAAAMTAAGMVLGTPSYMAPEQGRGSTSIDGRADVYALGCMLFAMLCGRPPFTCRAPGELLAAHARQAPPSPRQLEPSIPPGLERELLKALAKDPGARHADMTAFSLALAGATTASADRSTRLLPVAATSGTLAAVDRAAEAAAAAAALPRRTTTPSRPAMAVADDACPTLASPFLPELAPTRETPRMPAPSAGASVPAARTPGPTGTPATAYEPPPASRTPTPAARTAALTHPPPTRTPAPRTAASAPVAHMPAKRTPTPPSPGSAGAASTPAPASRGSAGAASTPAPSPRASAPAAPRGSAPVRPAGSSRTRDGETTFGAAATALSRVSAPRSVARNTRTAFAMALFVAGGAALWRGLQPPDPSVEARPDPSLSVLSARPGPDWTPLPPRPTPPRNATEKARSVDGRDGSGEAHDRDAAPPRAAPAGLDAAEVRAAPPRRPHRKKKRPGRLSVTPQVITAPEAIAPSAFAPPAYPPPASPRPAYPPPASPRPASPFPTPAEPRPAPILE